MNAVNAEKRLGISEYQTRIEEPLSKASINGILAQAIVNRMAYNRVFTHTPRNTFKPLLEGRQKYPPLTKKVKRYSVNGVPVGSIDPVTRSLRDPYIIVDEPTGTNDFSKMPDLQPAFMNGGRHNITKAIAELRATVKGFLVEMPLDWGIGESETPPAPQEKNAIIARTDQGEESYTKEA